MIRTISIFESNPICQDELKRLVLSIKGFRLHHVCKTENDLYRLFEDPSEFILMDISAQKEFQRVMNIIHELNRRTKTKIILYSYIYDEEWIRRFFRNGIYGYILYDASFEEIRVNLEVALEGGIPMSRQVSKLLLNGFMATVKGEGREDDPKISSDIISQIESCIEEYIIQKPSLKTKNLSDFLCERLHMSYGHLSNLYHSQKGKSITSYRQSIQISHVKHLLLNTTMSLTQISDQMNYSSVAHLSSNFQRLTGQNPSAFRKGM